MELILVPVLVIVAFLMWWWTPVLMLLEETPTLQTVANILMLVLSLLLSVIISLLITYVLNRMINVDDESESLNIAQSNCSGSECEPEQRS